MSDIKDQPAPQATNHRPTWEIVVGYASRVFPLSEDPIARQVIDDMQARDSIGRERYGIPLTAGNGRCALVDAYQERLDAVAYLAQWLAEQGVDVDEIGAKMAAGTFNLEEIPEHARDILGLFVNDAAYLAIVRGAINAKSS